MRANRVVTVTEMREIEQRAEAEYGLTSPMLMEHAGRSIAEALRERVGGRVEGLRTLVLAGPGNNGGDGRVMGRYLRLWGARVLVYDWKRRVLEPEQPSDEPAAVDDTLNALRSALGQADVVADALLGTGHSRPLDPRMAEVLALADAERARRSQLLVLAVDLPSGLNADTGVLDPGVIRADVTVTLACPKVGLFLFPGAEMVGQLIVGSIGLPEQMQVPAGLEMLTGTSVRPLLPQRPLDSNKGTFGKALIVAGSSLYLGAAYLATAAAARVGAGLVTLATTAARAPFYAVKLAEATYHLLPDDSVSPEARARDLLDAASQRTSLVIGPGLGQDDETRAWLRLLFTHLRDLSDAHRPRVVIDADGLNNLARMDRWWELLPPESVLTPHPGEMTRLRGGAAVSGGGPDRLSVALECARAWGHVVVLKGACTLVAEPHGAMRIYWPPNPALASAGTGDVLAGTIGGLLAQGMTPFDAACAGIYLHAQAGQRVRAHLGDAGLLASDLLDELPRALRAVKVEG